MQYESADNHSPYAVNMAEQEALHRGGIITSSVAKHDCTLLCTGYSSFSCYSSANGLASLYLVSLLEPNLSTRLKPVHSESNFLI